MGRLQRVRRHAPPDRSSRGSPTRVPEGEARRSRSASTAVTSSTATRTAWRSASAASCARACARRSASTCAAPTTRPTTPVSPGERYGFVYEINYLRCIHCDLCVEACPTEAITETKLFEFSFTNRADAIYTKDELLVDDDGRARRQPWELWLGGEDDDTSAWMRATVAVGRRRVRGPRRLVGRARLRRARRPSRASSRADAVAEPAPTERSPTSTSRSRARLMDAVDLLRLRRRSRSPARSASCSRATRCTRRCSLVVTLVSVAVLFLQQDAAARRRGPDHRLRGRDRRAVPVRDHAARRRPARVAATSRVRFQRPGRDRARRDRCSPRCCSSPATTGPPAPHDRARRRSSGGALGGNVERVARVPVHRLPLAVRDHRGAARDRGRRRRRARPAQRSAARGRRRARARRAAVERRR